MTSIDDMVDDILQDGNDNIKMYAIGSALYIQETGNYDAWIEGDAVTLGDWQ
jgi:hypothetical protein